MNDSPYRASIVAVSGVSAICLLGMILGLIYFPFLEKEFFNSISGETSGGARRGYRAVRRYVAQPASSQVERQRRQERGRRGSYAKYEIRAKANQEWAQRLLGTRSSPESRAAVRPRRWRDSRFRVSSL